ncbi:uncharacterized protein LOC114324902 [Diabrotica virgifera virgifera]|uniref:Uncharacterized protein LOC114324902 n=1 Tax=Diabrotica virgifera virgifera TaxID=50390 RepID=A0A6P7EZA2_DIAVI|nr:uncharacterized protein LOC114324902 [Diabrotica virgifera virgifera]
MMRQKTVFLVVFFCNLVYIQCFPYHLHSHDDAAVKDDLSDVRPVTNNLPLEDIVDNNEVDLKDPVAVRCLGLGLYFLGGLGQLAGGIVDVVVKGADFLFGSDEQPPCEIPEPPCGIPQPPCDIPEAPCVN